MFIIWQQFDGTDRTGTRPLSAWAALDDTAKTPDQTSTWYTTNDATWEITGIQVEVGSQATAFEHRSFNEELALCQRYYFQTSGYTKYGTMYATSNSFISLDLPVTMRTDPSTATATLGGGGSVSTNYSTKHYYQQYVTGDVSVNASEIKMDAEL